MTLDWCIGRLGEDCSLISVALRWSLAELVLVVAVLRAPPSSIVHTPHRGTGASARLGCSFAGLTLSWPAAMHPPSATSSKTSTSAGALRRRPLGFVTPRPPPASPA